MKINQQTRLFEELTDEEAKEMLEVADDLVFRGQYPNPVPEWIDLWMKEMGLDDDQIFIVTSQALPQRIYRSLINHLDHL